MFKIIGGSRICYPMKVENGKTILCLQYNEEFFAPIAYIDFDPKLSYYDYKKQSFQLKSSFYSEKCSLLMDENRILTLHQCPPSEDERIMFILLDRPGRPLLGNSTADVMKAIGTDENTILIVKFTEANSYVKIITTPGEIQYYYWETESLPAHNDL